MKTVLLYLTNKNLFSDCRVPANAKDFFFFYIKVMIKKDTMLINVKDLIWEHLFLLSNSPMYLSEY